MTLPSVLRIGPPPPPAPLREIRVVIPGEPIGQGRARATVVHGHAVVYDPPESKDWKITAQARYETELYVQVRGRPAFPKGTPLDLYIVAVHLLPLSRHRAHPVPRQRKTSTPDTDNIAKAVKDAGNGVLWHDDAQVVRETVEKWFGAQGEPPAVYVQVRVIDPAPAPVPPGRLF